MREKVLRNYQMTREWYHRLEASGYLPKRTPFLEFLSDRDAAGRSSADFSNFVQRRLISEDMARCFIEFLKTDKYHECNDDVRQKLILESEFTFASMFEKIPPNALPKIYEQPDSQNDPLIAESVVKACLYVLTAAGRALFMVAGANRIQDSDSIYLDVDSGPQEFERAMYIEIGYSQSKKGEELSVDEAYLRGLDSSNNPVGFLGEYAKRLININPNFVRYAITNSGKKIGLTSAYAITDEAFEATLRGEREIYSYSDRDIVPTSNNIVLFGHAELHESEYRMTTMKKRLLVTSSLFKEIASIIQPETRRPIRAISYEYTTANTARLRNMGYLAVKEFNQPRNYTVVAYEPFRRRGLLRQATLMIDDVIWRVREAADRVSYEEDEIDSQSSIARPRANVEKIE